MRAMSASALLVLALLSPIVSSVRSMREARSRTAVRGAASADFSPLSLATMMGSGTAAKAAPLSPGQSLRDSVINLTGFSLPMSVPVSDACDATGVAAKVPGDDVGSRWVLQLPGSVASCTVSTFLTSAATGVPASVSSAGAFLLQLEFDGSGTLTSYTVYGEASPSSSSSFPGTWLDMIHLSGPLPFATVSPADGSAVYGVLGIPSSALVFPAGTAAVLTADASGLGSTLRMRKTVSTSVGALVSSAASAVNVDSGSLSRGLAWSHLNSLTLSTELSAVIYSATLSGSPSNVALAAATGGLSFGMRVASTTTLAGGVTAEVEVVFALLGSGGIDPALASLLASGNPADIAKAMADKATSSAADLASAAQTAATSAASKAATKAADAAVNTAVKCAVNAAGHVSSGGPTRAAHGKGSLKCLPRPPLKASAKAMLAKSLAKAKASLSTAIKGALTSAVASAGTVPQWQPVAWVGASMRVADIGAAFNALGATVSGLDVITGFLSGFLPPGEITAVVAVSSDDADLSQLPADITPDALALLGTGFSVSKGLVVQFAVAPPPSCGGGAGAMLCKLVQKLVSQDRPLRFKLPSPDDLAGLTASIEIDDIPLSSKVTLQSVALTAVAEPPSVGIAATMSLAVQGGNFLLLSASISEGVGVLNLAASMMGTWQGAFGWKQLDLSNLALSTSITETIPPVPKAFMFQGSAAAYAPGTFHDGCKPGGIAASAQKCVAFTMAMGYNAAPPTAWFYASLTSVELGHGLTMGALPCIFAGACLGPSNPLYDVLNAVSITAATVSSADMPQALLDGTPVPAGLSFSGAASICGLVDVALNINMDAKSGSAAVAAAAKTPGFSLAFAGGFAGSDPAASYMYAGFAIHLNVPKVLCSLGKLCSLPSDVRAMLGSGELDIRLAVSRAGTARTITIKGSAVTIDIPEGFHLALGLNFFDFMKADATFAITNSGKTSASISLGAIEFGGVMLCRTMTDCTKGPQFAASLSSPASASLQAYAKLFNIANFAVNAVISENAQSVAAEGVGMMGMKWATEVAMTGKLGRPSSIAMSLTLSPSDLSKIEREVVGFLGSVIADAKKALSAVENGAKSVAGGVKNAAKSAGKSLKKAFHLFIEEEGASHASLVESTDLAAARAVFALRSITAKMSIEAKHVKGGFDPSATISLDADFVISGKAQKLKFKVKINSKDVSKEIVNGLKSIVKDAAKGIKNL